MRSCSAGGIKPDRVLSCGDGLNDVPMFELTGHSIAVNGGSMVFAQPIRYVEKRPRRVLKSDCVERRTGR